MRGRPRTLVPSRSDVVARFFARFFALLAVHATGSVAACTTAPRADAPAELSITIDGSRFFGLAFGASLQLPIVVRNAARAALPLPGPVAFVSRDTAVVTVDATGRITSRRTGLAWVVGTLRTGGRTLVDSVQLGVTCTAELQARLTPIATSITVGQGFTPDLELTTCGGHVRVTEEVTWSATDTSVVRVEASTGQTTGRARGQALVQAIGRRHGPLGFILVTVTP